MCCAGLETVKPAAEAALFSNPNLRGMGASAPSEKPQQIFFGDVRQKQTQGCVKIGSFTLHHKIFVSGDATLSHWLVFAAVA